MHEEHLYRPPASPDAEPPVRQGSPVKAVLAGIAVCLVGGYALRTLLILAVTLPASRSIGANIGSEEAGMSSENLEAMLVSLSLAANLSMGILAGFVSARLSPDQIPRDVGIVILVSGGLKLGGGLLADPPLLIAVSTLGTVAALAYGAWIGLRSLRKKERLSANNKVSGV